MNKRYQEKGMRPIWYFVGWMLLIIGFLIVTAGILNLFLDLPSSSVVAETHPDLWWGGFIIIVGGFYIWKYHSVKIN